MTEIRDIAKLLSSQFFFK